MLLLLWRGLIPAITGTRWVYRRQQRVRIWQSMSLHECYALLRLGPLTH